MTRGLKQKIKVFVEGDTEYNYIEGIRKQKGIQLSLENVNMHGGGYTSFTDRIRKMTPLSFIAVFIIIDLDKAITNKKDFHNLIKLCKTKTKTTKIPYIVIGNNKDFEYFACCHCPKYKNTDTKSYIVKNFKVKDIAKFKSKKDIYTFLNKDGRSLKIALNKINKNKYFNYDLEKVKKGANIDIKVKKLEINENALNFRHSNIDNFIDIVFGKDVL